MNLRVLLIAVLSIILVPAVLVAYSWIAEKFVGVTIRGAQTREQVRSYFWIAPAFLLLAVFLVYPVISTIITSLLGPQGHKFVAFGNYGYIFSNPDMLIVLRNNLLWLVVFTFLTTAIGLAMAVLADRVRYENVVKAILFLPMAISYVAAGVIWKFMYQFQPAGATQTGTLNALIVSIFPGFQPQAWLINSPGNTFALIAVGVWIWAGFCMVIISASLKGIPKDVLDSARIDGATEMQLFWRITVPLISSTLTVVVTTMIINVLKIFDIVYVMTSGNYNTDVIANSMYKQMFIFQDYGRAAATAVILFLAVIPVVVVNIRKFVTPS
ncbi:MAG TPA: sugar ABC transporter permease [Spirochaetia bacterium]|nr:sugar ABC transporter permease [Spirochaetia bacterium]